MDDDRARELLAHERERIETALARANLGERDEDADTIDPGDSAEDLTDAELDLGLIDSLREELAAIDRAERRLDEGTYGRSIQSGEEIPDERLEAIPWAELTAEEQARVDAGR